MSCVLRVSGTEFDVDDFMEKSGWVELLGAAMRVHHKGEYVNRLKRRVFDDYGFSIIISDKSFDDFEAQQKDAVAFVQKYLPELQSLSQYKIDRWKSFDFGLDVSPPDHFSEVHIIKPDVLRAIGESGIEIYISNYFTQRDRIARRIKRKRWWPFKKYGYKS